MPDSAPPDSGPSGSGPPDSGPSGSGAGTLFLVPTPIGNHRDISSRAADVLRDAAVIAAEDTRKAGSLLRALGIRARLLSYYDFNEQARSDQLLRLLLEGQDVAVISDAGTPLVSDPGFRIVRAAIAAGLRVCPLPGPSAALTALIGSGLPAHRFEFAGFLPRKPAARRTAIGLLGGSPATLIFFEGPHRLAATVADLRSVLGDRDAVLARNLTKADEEFLRGRLSALEAELTARAATAPGIRGEFTVLVAGADEADTEAAEQLASQLARSLLRRDVPAHVARDVVREVTGLPRNQVYRAIQAATDSGQPDGEPGHPEKEPG
jgi:16S rRNA (cytidine1402-2'-O)-methyltransferase